MGGFGIMPLHRSTTIKASSKEMRSIKKLVTPAGETETDCFGAFRAKYLGSVTVADATGDATVADASKRVVGQREAIKVFIVVSATEVKVLKMDTNEVVQSTSMTQVVYTGSNPENKKVVSYTSKSALGVLHCHLFLVKEKGVEIVKELSRAIKSVPHTFPPMGESTTESLDGTELQNRTNSKKSDCREFDVLYLGCQTVEESMGRDVVSRAIAQNAADVQRRESVAGKRGEFQGDPVTLVLTPLSIRTVEGRSGDTILNDFIHHVTFSRVDDTVPGMEVFAYISCEERVNSKTCHVFGVGPGVGRHIREELKEMVRLNEAQATTGNPFTAIPGCPREVPQGQLFSKQIHRGDLTPVKVIGAGQYGEVYLAVQTARLPASKGGGLVKLKRAVKMVRNNATREDKDEFLREADTMVILEHENLVKMIGVAVQQAPWLAVLEFCEHGDVRSVVRACNQNQIQLTAEEQVCLCQQLASGMAHLTAQRLVHMDLAARNCLLAHANVVKVADFGLTRKLDKGTSHLVLREKLKLPLKWLSVEALDKKVFGESSDCWSFGVLMWEILSYGETPYVDIRTADVQSQIRNGVRLQMPPGSDRDFWAIVTRCWSADPKARWTFAQLQVSLRELMMRLPSGPKRDIGIFLKTKGRDTGVSNPRLKSPKEMFQATAMTVMAAQRFKTQLNKSGRPSTAPQQAPRTPVRQPENGSASVDRDRALANAASMRSPPKTPLSAAQIASPSSSTPLTSPMIHRSPQTKRPSTAPRQFPARPGAVAPRRAESNDSRTSGAGPATAQPQPQPASYANPLSILSRLGLPQYGPMLREKKVTPYMFHHADDDVLQEIGVASPQHRKFILDYIRQHRGSGASDPKPKPTPAHRSPSTKQRDPAREAQKEATRAMLEAKRAELARVQQEAARRKQLADDLVGDDASTRQAARKEAHIRVTDSPATAAQRRRISQQEALDNARAAQKKKEAAEDARREVAIKRHSVDAQRLARDQREADKKEEVRLRQAREAAEVNKEATQRKRLSSFADGSRTASLITQREAEKQRSDRASKLSVDGKSEKRMSIRKSSAESLFGKEEEWGAGKSKIWKALNPQPLAFQTARDRATREENKLVVDGTRKGHGADFLLLNTVAHEQTDLFAAEEDDEGVADDESPVAALIRPTPPLPAGGDGMNRTPVKNEEEEEGDEEVAADAGGVGESGDLDGDIEAMMMKMRAKREADEVSRQAKLREKFAAQKKSEQEELEKELAVIRAQQEMERQEQEQAKDKLVQDAHSQHEELVFNFAWG